MTARKPGPPPKIVPPEEDEPTPSKGAPAEAPPDEPWWHIHPHRMSLEQRTEIFDELFYDGKEERAYLLRFTVLLSLSVLIAVLGIALDSAPIVIGAMLISPLTTPLQGLSVSLILGWPRRQLETALILIGGTAGGIGLAYLTLAAIPEPQNQTLAANELLSRTEPRLLDLGVAIFAGAAGAYVLTRKRALSALPGVAIAVALVPPLAVTGMALELGRNDLAENALLLYVVNLAGIVFSGSLVLLAMGMFPVPVNGRIPRLTKIGLGVAVVGVAAVAYPVGQLTTRALNEDRDRRDVERLVERWIGDRQLELGEIELVNGSIDIDVAGPVRPPGPHNLTRNLADELEQEVEVTIHWTKRSRIESSSAPG